MAGTHAALRFRAGTAEDGADLRRVHARAVTVLGRRGYSETECASWAAGLEAERYGEAMAEGEFFDLALSSDGELLGFSSRRKREILALFVDPDHAGRGVATALAERAEQAVAGQGFPKIVVGAAMSGVGFYERRGYRIDERRLWTTRGGLPLEVAWMSKSLIRAVSAGTPPEPPLARLRAGGDAALSQAIEEAAAGRTDSALLEAAWLDQRGVAVALVGPSDERLPQLLQHVLETLRAREVNVVLLGRLPEELWQEPLHRLPQAQAADQLAVPIMLARALRDLVLIVDGRPGGDALSQCCDKVVQCVGADGLELLAGWRQAPGSAPDTVALLDAAAQVGPWPGGPAVLPATDSEKFLDALLERPSGLAERRHEQSLRWVEEAILREHGQRGLERLRKAKARLRSDGRTSPFRRLRDLLSLLDEETGG